MIVDDNCIRLCTIPNFFCSCFISMWNVFRNGAHVDREGESERSTGKLLEYQMHRVHRVSEYVNIYTKDDIIRCCVFSTLSTRLLFCSVLFSKLMGKWNICKHQRAQFLWEPCIPPYSIYICKIKVCVPIQCLSAQHLDCAQRKRKRKRNRKKMDAQCTHNTEKRTRKRISPPPSSFIPPTLQSLYYCDHNFYYDNDDDDDCNDDDDYDFSFHSLVLFLLLSVSENLLQNQSVMLSWISHIFLYGLRARAAATKLLLFLCRWHVSR